LSRNFNVKSRKSDSVKKTDPKMKNFDPDTGQFDFSVKIPDGDELERSVCNQCGFIDYINPKIVVGSVALWEGKILMCRREIEPRRGFWTLPAGYMEENETTEEGAIREAQEEACADLTIEALLAVYSIPRISQVQLMHVARLNSADVSPGPESQEVALFTWDEIPWAELAFPSVLWALNHYNEIKEQTRFVPFQNPPGGTEAFMALQKG
jgi:ADP-ribose pyrophosphatase YjhB (NUDIX family)